MAGLKRRTRVEGWALDVSDGEEVGYRSTLQRIGDNNRLWLVTLAVVLVVSAVLIQLTRRQSTAVDKPAGPPRAKMDGSYLDQEHQDFTAKFVREKGRDGAIVEARFLSDRRFAFVVPGETSADDIEYLSKMAAELYKARFGAWVTVEAYQRSAENHKDILRATTTWVRNRYGFIVHFKPTRE